MVKSPTASAGDTGSNPGLGSFHVPQGNQAHVPQLLKPACTGARALQREATEGRSLHTAAREQPCWRQLEKGWAQRQRASTAKSKQKSDEREPGEEGLRSDTEQGGDGAGRH